jgi:hypothetical protein
MYRPEARLQSEWNEEKEKGISLTKRVKCNADAARCGALSGRREKGGQRQCKVKIWTKSM